MAFGQSTFVVPGGLETDEFLLRSITASDAELDYEAVMDSRDVLRRWNQSEWPEDDFTIEANRQDLTKMERRHASREAFGYTVMNPDQSQCLGCVYMFPPDANWFSDRVVTQLGDDQWSDCDALVLFWVRTSALPDGLDRTLLNSLVDWLDQEWPFAAPVIMTNELVDQQVTMIEDNKLTRRFEIKLGGESGKYLAYA